MDSRFIIHIDKNTSTPHILKVKLEEHIIPNNTSWEGPSYEYYIIHIYDRTDFDFLLNTKLEKNSYDTHENAYNNLVYNVFFREYSDEHKLLYGKFEHTGHIKCNKKEFFHINGKINGKMVIYDYNDRIECECYYMNGILNGSFNSYYYGKNEISCVYVNGKIEGEYTHSTENFNMKCIYKNGTKNGLLAYTDKNIHVETSYVDDEEHGERRVFRLSDLKLIDRCEYVKNKKHGTRYIYGDNYEIVENYSNGYYDGNQYEYKCDKNGKMIMSYSGFYKNGREGLFTYYDEEGEPSVEQIFKNDLKLSEIDNKKRIVSFYKWGKSTYEEKNVKIKYKYYDDEGNIIKVEKIKDTICFDGYTQYSENYDYCDNNTNEYHNDKINTHPGFREFLHRQSNPINGFWYFIKYGKDT